LAGAGRNFLAKNNQLFVVLLMLNMLLCFDPNHDMYHKCQPQHLSFSAGAMAMLFCCNILSL